MDIISLIALALNLITLVIVFFQTIYTKKALNTAQISIELVKTSRQLEQLPDLHLIIQVTMFLNQWKNDLKSIIKYISENNANEIIDISKTDPIRPAGLLDKNLYESLPQWLSVIYASGAQYYYDSSCLYQYLWSVKDNRISGEDDLNRFQDSLRALEVLSKYIKDEVPQVFLHCPASVNTSAFFKKE